MRRRWLRLVQVMRRGGDTQPGGTPFLTTAPCKNTSNPDFLSELPRGRVRVNAREVAGGDHGPGRTVFLTAANQNFRIRDISIGGRE